MAYTFLDLAATPSVRAAWADMGVDRVWAGREHDRPSERFTAAEREFIAGRDTFYMASVSETGWPYVQHRGGPPGFLKVVDDTTLAFADYRGNRQYISLGNTSANDRVALILMDYPQRARLKIFAHAEVVGLDAEPDLRALVSEGTRQARPERIFRLKLAAFDWNCPQHITPRWTAAEIAAAMQPVEARLAALEAENADLRARLGLPSEDSAPSPT